MKYADQSTEPLAVIEANECNSELGSLCTNRFRRLFNEIESLTSALLNTACRTDGDGKPCWCCDQITLRSGLFRNDHDGWCRNARTALESIEKSS